MRTLYLCRHAKSSWGDPGQRDFDRPLNDRGTRDAPFMARLFRDRNEPVDLLISSDANRAQSTARYFAAELWANPARLGDAAPLPPQLWLEHGLYHATVPTILATVNALPDDATRVMLFGHNPGFTDAVTYFSHEDIGNLPTCGLVRIDFPVDRWKEVSRDQGTLLWSDYPKRHPGQG